MYKRALNIQFNSIISHIKIMHIQRFCSKKLSGYQSDAHKWNDFWKLRHSPKSANNNMLDFCIWNRYMYICIDELEMPVFSYDFCWRMCYFKLSTRLPGKLLISVICFTGILNWEAVMYIWTFTYTLYLKMSLKMSNHWIWLGKPSKIVLYTHAYIK